MFFSRCKPLFPLFYACLASALLLLAGCTSGILQERPTEKQVGITSPRPPALRSLPSVSTSSAQPVTMAPLDQGNSGTSFTSSAPSQKTKVALLLPLSGPHTELGQAMVNAAQLAVFDIAPQNFELIPRDTGTTTVQAVSAAKQALADGAQLVLGPLFASDVSAVRAVVRNADIPMLALSTDVSLAGQGVYIMGFAPAPQIERIVSYAVARGLRRFAALVPANPYGELVSSLFAQAVKNHGAELIATEKVANLAFLAARKDSFDALLLPFGGQELFRLAAALEKEGFDKEKIKILGTGLWDDSFVAEGQPFLLGGWYATAEPNARAKFEEAYGNTYGAPPPRLATLAYDATALAAVLTNQERRFDDASLTNPVGFTGLDGLFRLVPKGYVERGLAVAKIESYGVTIVDPAPTRFIKRGP